MSEGMEDTEEALRRRLLAAGRFTPGQLQAAERLRAGPPQRGLAEVLVARGWIAAAELREYGVEAVESTVAPRAPLGAAPALHDGERSATPPGPSSPTDAVRAEAVASYRKASAQDPEFAPHAGVALELVEELGRGGMGQVLRVRDRRLGREAALKLLLPEHASEADAARFAREARLTARLDHPGIPPVYEAGTEEQGRRYLLMKVIEGQPLARRLKAHDHSVRVDAAELGRLRELLEVVVKVGEAVAYAHGQGVVHRDLKPENVVVGRFGEVMVLDWGLARDLAQSAAEDEAFRRSVTDEVPARGPTDATSAERGAARGRGGTWGGEATPRTNQGPTEPAGGKRAEPQLTEAGSTLGTPGYMPPEQAAGEPVDERSDVFALGALLTEVLTGAPPIVGSTVVNRLLATVEGRLARPRDRRPGLPRDLAAIADAALEPDRDRRTGSAEHLVADLRAYLAGEPVSVHRYGPSERARRWARRRPTLFAGAIVGALGLGTAVGAAVTAGQRARSAAEREALVEARRRAEAAAVTTAGLAERGLEPDARTAEALEALVAAQRYYDMAERGETPAAHALFRAAQTLGQVALETEQWALAEDAFRRATDLGGDDGRGEELLASVEEVRRARAERRRRVVRGLLKEARSGALGERPQGVTDAMFRIVRAGPAVVEQVTEALNGATERLAERGALTRSQRDLVRLCCGSLGRLGVRDGAVAALGRYLEVETSQMRAMPAGVALARLGGEAARDHIDAACRRFGVRGFFARRVSEQLVASGQREPRSSGPLELESAEAYVRRATRREGRGDLAGASEDYDRAIELDPDHPTAYHHRGSLHARRGDMTEAIADHDRAIELDPDDPSAYNDRGVAREEIGDLEGAIGDFTRALELDPRHVFAYTNRGFAREKLGNPERAIEDFTRAVEIDPRFAKAYGARGALRGRLGDLEGAIEDCTRAIELDPRDVSGTSPYAHRGFARAKLGRLEGAITDFDRAIELHPRAAKAYQNRGAARRQLGDPEGALADLTRAIELAPRNPGGYWSRGVVRYERGELAGAIADWERFVELAPDHPKAQHVRAQIGAARERLKR